MYDIGKEDESPIDKQYVFFFVSFFFVILLFPSIFFVIFINKKENEMD